MAGNIPSLFDITGNDHGGYVAVTGYTLLILTLGVVVTRVFTRWYIVRSIKADDYFLIAAALLGILQTSFIQLALNNGLGRRRHIVSDEEFLQYQKYDYVAHILSISTVAFSKISAGFLVQSLLAEGYSIKAGKILIGVIAAWAVSSILALAFQCSLPHPWDDASGACVDRASLHNAISSLNIITDLFLVILPCFVVWRIKTSSKERRYSILALFSIRLFVCTTTGIELKHYQDSFLSSDETWSSIDATIWEIIAMNLSIIFTAIPSIGRLLVELQPAVNAFAITELHGARSHDDWALSSLAGRFQKDYVAENRLGVNTSIIGSRVSRRYRDTSDRAEKGESVKGLREGVIHQTMDVRMY